MAFVVAGVLALGFCYVGTGRTLRAFHAAPGRALRARFLGFGGVAAAAFLLVKCPLAAILRDVNGPEVLGLIVPSLLLEGWVACRFWLALPVMAVERTPVLEALARSLELTRGNRIRSFFLIGSVMAIQTLGFFLLAASVAGAVALALVTTALHAALVATAYRDVAGTQGHEVARVFA